MATGQVSIWVPVVVAMLGVIGVIAGQLVNSWREDRRWARELAREDLRWKREHERLQAEREHEVQIYWRNERLRSYSNTAGITQLWSDLLYQAVQDREKEIAPSEERLKQLHELHGRVQAAFAEIALVGSPRTREICWDFLTEHELALRFIEGERGRIDREELDEYCERLHESLRVELGMKPHNPPERLAKWRLLPPAQSDPDPGA